MVGYHPREGVEMGSDLTEQEKSALILIGEGLTNACIARKVHLSTDGLASLITRLMKRSGARNRANLVVRGVQMGWITITLSDEFPLIENLTKIPGTL